MEKLDLSGLELPDKEKRILEAAVNIFSEKGFSAATTSEIAKQAGVAEGTIFRYFKTKKDILRGILIHMINIFSRKMVIDNVEKMFLDPGDKDIRTLFKEFVKDRLKLVDSIFPMVRVVLGEAMYHEDVREAIYKNIIVKAVEIFTAFQNKMAEKGILREDVEPEVIIRSIMGNIAILVAQRKMFGNIFNVTDMDKEIDKMVDVVLYGISKEGSSKL
jgi:AcrR family transcriptional regulator